VDSIYFSHGDLTLENIMIAGPPGAQTVVGIVDWEQAGWFPEYWEFCKMCYAVNEEHEWCATGWVDKVMNETYEDTWFAVLQYFVWRGCP
jgi:thiamine kinase-like enzyme